MGEAGRDGQSVARAPAAQANGQEVGAGRRWLGPASSPERLDERLEVSAGP